MLVVIHGNIGAGKTSAVTKLAASPLGGSKDAPIVYSEAVCDWQPWLSRAYADPQRGVVALQMMITATNLRMTANIQADLAAGKTVVSERSPLDALRVFVPATSELIGADRTRVLKALLDDCFVNPATEIADNPWAAPSTIHIYLRVPAQACYERVRRRARIGEEHVDLEYLQKIESRYDQWLEEIPECITLNRTMAEAREGTAVDVAALLREAIHHTNKFA